MANNGNVKQITNNLNAARTQTFTYDEMNRVKTALTQGTTGSLCWGLDYSYDIYANLTTVALDAARPSCTWTTLNAGISTNNRITNAGFSYDAAGNVLSDGNFSYTWDAESQLKTAAGVTYTYDGDGRRVQKSNGKLYWYGAGGEVIAESDASGNFTDEYVFLGGKRIARRNVSSGNVYYFFADHLGSSRVVLQSGQSTACYDADFDPFGGEHIVTNTCPQNYKFTGKERDAESGLDDFEARYYSSQFGRFHSADWSAIPVPVPYADLGNPQTLNLYAYVKNNPMNLTDPTGHLATGQLGSLEGLSVTPRLPPGNAITEPYINVDPPSEAALEAMAVNNAIAIAELIAQQSAQPQQQSAPDSISVGEAKVLSDCKGCSGYGIKIAVTYQLNSSGNPLQAEGYVMQEKLSGGELVYPTASGNVYMIVTFNKGWGDVGPTAENGNQRVTNSKGQFTDAPVGVTDSRSFTHHATQELRAVGRDGKVVSFGKNKITVTSDSKGHGRIRIDNKEMNIHLRLER